MNVCQSVRMFQFQNRWTDFDEMSFGRYAVGGHPKLMTDGQTCEV
jgi:hypothetical protein